MHLSNSSIYENVGCAWQKFMFNRMDFSARFSPTTLRSLTTAMQFMIADFVNEMVVNKTRRPFVRVSREKPSQLSIIIVHYQPARTNYSTVSKANEKKQRRQQTDIMFAYFFLLLCNISH
jgi:hypothetical protein